MCLVMLAALLGSANASSINGVLTTIGSMLLMVGLVYSGVRRWLSVLGWVLLLFLGFLVVLFLFVVLLLGALLFLLLVLGLVQVHVFVQLEHGYLELFLQADWIVIQKTDVGTGLNLSFVWHVGVVVVEFLLLLLKRVNLFFH